MPKLIWLFLLSLHSSCSAVLAWQEANLPCDSNHMNACFEGYSCAPALSNSTTNVCATDGSRTDGEICALDQQCNDGLCPDGHCEPSCALNQAYSSTEPCGPAEVCHDYYSIAGFNDGLAHAPMHVTACSAADGCMPNNLCSEQNGTFCIQVSESATACLTGCEITFQAGVYTDNCGISELQTPLYCTPLGVLDNQGLVCMDSTNQPQSLGSACSAVSEPCAPGQGCINGICRHWCQPLISSTVSNCPLQDGSGVVCQSLTLNANLTVGYCLPGTSL